ncbi:glycosyltransferase family 4 protein [Agromyces sp. MMS24-JH15]|uniref:glycosyltransferase family 4 protein n=1 Tax=Agromyces sp. MMS24-JH15 TaxID=3243765 RepID=UPI0037495C6B
MTIRLRVVVDAMAAPGSGPSARYTRDLTEALIRRAPGGTAVEGIVSSSPPEEYDAITAALPGLADLYKTSLARRELRAAWQLGLTTSPGGGIIHSPTLLAPMRRHDPAGGDQVVVTVHDTIATTHPDSLSSAEAAWRRAMLKRARKHADAIVATSHALATRLEERYGFGDRLRVVPPAPRGGLTAPGDEERRAALGLPGQYLVTVGTLEPRTGLVDLLTALARPGVPDLPLVIAGPATWGEQHVAAAADDAGLRPGRVRAIDGLTDAEYGTLLRHASAFIAPAHAEGHPEVVIEALSAGLPVVHSDTPEYTEAAAGSGLVVAVGVGGDPYADRLAASIAAVVEDRALADRMRIGGLDRARAFSWDDAADRTWQLHADL